MGFWQRLDSRHCEATVVWCVGYLEHMQVGSPVCLCWRLQELMFRIQEFERLIDIVSRQALFLEPEV